MLITFDQIKCPIYRPVGILTKSWRLLVTARKLSDPDRNWKKFFYLIIVFVGYFWCDYDMIKTHCFQYDVSNHISIIPASLPFTFSLLKLHRNLFVDLELLMLTSKLLFVTNFLIRNDFSISLFFYLHPLLFVTKFRIPRTEFSVKRVSSSRWTSQSSDSKKLFSSSRQNWKKSFNKWEKPC